MMTTQIRRSRPILLAARLTALAAIAAVEACSPVSATHPSAPDTSTEDVVMDVDHYREACPPGVGAAYFCMRVSNPSGRPFTREPQGIQGFQPAWGTSYRIRVHVRHVPHPPADASNVEYKLAQIVSQRVAPPGTEFSISMLRDSSLLVEGAGGELELKGERKLACLDEGACRAARSWVREPPPAPRYGPGPSLHLTLRYADQPGAPFVVVASSITN